MTLPFKNPWYTFYMIKTIRSSANLLVLTAIMMISVHTAAVLTTYCSGNTACLGGVYFGVPAYQTTLPVMATDIAYSSPTVISEANRGFTFADFHLIVQAVGLYALLAGVLMIIALQIIELKNVNKLFKRKLLKW